jgi:hypothetical protein
LSKTVVDIGVACSGGQVSTWWNKIMSMLLYTDRSELGIQIGRIHAISSALPDHNKNNMITKKRNQLTDMNRNEISGGFLDGNADWLMQIDDDTVPPQDAIIRLLKSQREFISGLYFNTHPPFNPIAYYRHKNGLYNPVYDYPKGLLAQVDSVGMGCSLIHRSVFTKIRDAHDVYIRPDGSYFAFPKDRVKGKKLTGIADKKAVIRDSELIIPVRLVDEDDTRVFPFYMMEYGRTEDHWFCELAANVGIKPWLDATVECLHIKPNHFGVENYDKFFEENPDYASS